MRESPCAHVRALMLERMDGDNPPFLPIVSAVAASVAIQHWFGTETVGVAEAALDCGALIYLTILILAALRSPRDRANDQPPDPDV